MDRWPQPLPSFAKRILQVDNPRTKTESPTHAHARSRATVARAKNASSQAPIACNVQKARNLRGSSAFSANIVRNRAATRFMFWPPAARSCNNLRAWRTNQSLRWQMQLHQLIIGQLRKVRRRLSNITKSNLEDTSRFALSIANTMTLTNVRPIAHIHAAIWTVLNRDSNMPRILRTNHIGSMRCAIARTMTLE